VKIEDLGFRAMTSVATSKLGLLDRVFRSLERGAAAGALGGVAAATLFRRFGASTVVSAVGAVGVGTFCAKMGSALPEPGSVEAAGLDLRRVHISLNVGEVVLFPLAAGLALALSSEPSRKRDASVLLFLAALGAGATTAALTCGGEMLGPEGER
jgi:hypothetical protein